MQFKSIEQYFPKRPYQLQVDIANTLHSALTQQSCKVAIIQSPTGTGKTFSILCPILAWLLHNRTSLLQTQKSAKKDSLPPWLAKTSEQKGQKKLRQKQTAMSKLISIHEAQQTLKNKRKTLVEQKKNDLVPKNQKEEQQLQIDSDDDLYYPKNGKKTIQKQYQLTQKQLHIQDQHILPKLIFVSRTHSQLSQVMDSIKQIPSSQNLKYLELASKQQLCINKTVNQHKNSINQKCQHLLDHEHCPYMSQLSIKEFFNKNMNEIVQLGTSHGLCPYYSSRSILQLADIIYLPYSSILNRDIRDKLGINIHNSVIVFDQGHNLLEYEKQMRSPQVKIEDFQIMASQVDEYLKQYKQRLKMKNQKLLFHLLDILRSFATTCTNLINQNKTKAQHKYVSLKYIDFFLKLSLKQLNITKIIKYFQLNSMDRKLSYFNSKEQVKMKGPYQYNKISAMTVNKVLSFLKQFSFFDQKNQILLLKWNQQHKGTIKIMCLQCQQLPSIIQKSRMTIIAGGTMQPMSQLLTLTQPWKQKMIVKKYPHIIKDSQCQIYLIGKHNSQEIYFNHQNTTNLDALFKFKPICTQLLRKILDKTQKGGGIVLFIQNYQLIPFFQQIFKNQPYFHRILFDNKNKSDKQTQDIFSKYKKLVDSDHENSHILVSVMGGKLSQGINFSDRLARTLIVFGLPYSNIYSPQMIQSMKYLDQTGNPNNSGRSYYQNLCIKTLNQTIGRGVRHINDYVNIYLVDSRFQLIKQKLSTWMQPRIKVVTDSTFL